MSTFVEDVCDCHLFAVKMTFCEYVEKYMKPQTLDSLGNGNTCNIVKHVLFKF